ncbi:MAG: DUF393 domain-containing protein [Bacteroidetes bacterium]|nr:DUF393 domain-containing protein [Bacteroidota bacterium]
MKTLHHHTIIYDQECPLCNAYTGYFVKTGMLDDKGRVPFGEDTKKLFPTVDWERAKTEIALVNTTNGKTYYGIDSLITIIGQRFPKLIAIIRFDFIRFLVQKLYFLISYNRKVIAPGKVFEENHSCAPPVNFTYRWIYIMLAWVITSFVLLAYSFLLFPLVPSSELGREFLICGGQIIFQGAIVFTLRKDRLIHYLGNLMTVSLIGALMLTPMLLVGKLYHEPILFLLYFMMVVAWMFVSHWRRVKVLGIPFIVSITWVLYRLLVLLVILKLI